MPKQNVFSFIIKNCKSFKFYIACHLFVVVYQAIDISLWPYASKMLIDAVAASDRQNVVANATPTMIFLIVLTILPGIVWRLSNYSWMHLSPLLRKKITHDCATKLLNQSTNFFQNNFVGALVNRIKEISNSTPNLINVIIYNFLSVGLSLLIAFFTLFFVHKFFAFALLIWAAIFALMGIKAAKSTEEMSKNISDQSSKVTGNLADILSNFSNIKFFNGKKKEQDRINKFSDEYTRLTKIREFYLLKFFAWQGLTFSIYFGLCIYFLVLFYAQGLVSIGDFALVFTINSWMIHAMYVATQEMRTFVEEFAAVKYALNVVNQEIEVDDVAGAKSLKIEDAAKIVFENVNFSYDKKPQPSPRNIDFGLIGQATIAPEVMGQLKFFTDQSITIEAGQRVGLVGHSGSGKSTFINLILRNFNVNSGRILVGDENIADVTQGSLKAAIGLIPQEPTLFHRSLYENIAYAKDGASRDEIIAAARKAHAHEFIEKLPEKYDALVGERGIKLSGGQRQRIAIARAFLKNAPILILDEATSQLDSITENLIQDSLQELMQNKTALIIAHRLSTLQNMDRILVFDNGKIVEDGSHQQLLAQNGVYKKLYSAQIGGFLGDFKEPQNA